MTHLGLIWLDAWGSNRHAANAAFLLMHGKKLERLSPEEKEKFYALGKSQIDYILGDSGRSYVVGFGENPPKNPHHRKRFDNRSLSGSISINDRLLLALGPASFEPKKIVVMSKRQRRAMQTM